MKECCDHCKKPLPERWTVACYQICSLFAQYWYCSEECKQQHKMKLMRESGL